MRPPTPLHPLRQNIHTIALHEEALFKLMQATTVCEPKAKKVGCERPSAPGAKRDFEKISFSVLVKRPDAT
jgi:hypothetical protein